MQTIQIDGQKFVGPYIIGKDEIPQVKGIGLTITEAGEGFKIMSIVHGDDLREVIMNHPKMDCWKQHAYHGNIDVYICETDMSPDKREEFRIKGIEKRRDVIFCDEVPRIEDDW